MIRHHIYLQKQYRFWSFPPPSRFSGVYVWGGSIKGTGLNEVMFGLWCFRQEFRWEGFLHIIKTFGFFGICILFPFYAGNFGVSPIAEVCAPRNDVNIFYSPSSCAKSLVPKWRPGHCKNHNTPSLKNVHLKNGGSVPCKACFAGSWFPYFYFTYCLGWTFFSVKRSVKESVCNCTPSYTELQMVLWWISIVLQSYDVWICLVLLTLALGTAEWFILGVGIYIYIYSQDYSREAG